jgi:Xaa-Pro aminopeptidase
MFESLYQSFQELADPSQGVERIASLRREIAHRGLDGFLVPRADQHQNEYLPACEERLSWLTGFTGSAGLAIVLTDRAAIFVDGRYTIAVRDQVDVTIFTPVALAETSPEKWLELNLAKGAKLGFDPWLHTQAQVERYEKAAATAGAELVALETNPIDVIWLDRPEPPSGEISQHPTALSGEASAVKLARIAAALGRHDALVVSDPHAVAWAFNIRGRDVAHTPLPLAYALIGKDAKPRLYVEAGKLSQDLRETLAREADIEAPSRLEADLAALGHEGKSVLFDAATAAAKLTRLVENANGKLEIGRDPIALMKARKNDVELAGAREAQLRDGVAMVRFLHWFEAKAAKGKLTEIDAAEALESFRRDTRKLKDVSFPTIAAAGPNAASPHYHVTLKSNRRIEKGIFLIDSGGQYEDGTTDITRTLAVGKPSAEMRDRFTRVLKGNIAISRAVFPKGTSGAQIDALARAALWAAGLDFDHGTGHGVGSYLSVHEGPQRIAKLGPTALEPGMIISNEPGYYKAGAYGIRIENLVVVEPRKIKGGEREMYGFETITLAPIDQALIEPKLLDKDEIAWLDAYHARVRKALSPLVASDIRKWLKRATKRIGA